MTPFDTPGKQAFENTMVKGEIADLGQNFLQIKSHVDIAWLINLLAIIVCIYSSKNTGM